MVQNTRKKHQIPRNKDITNKGRLMQLLDISVWLPRRMHTEERLNEGPRFQLEREYEDEIKQNKRNVRERQHTTCNPSSPKTSQKNARMLQVRATCVPNKLWRVNQHGYACFGLSFFFDWICLPQLVCGTQQQPGGCKKGIPKCR